MKKLFFTLVVAIITVIFAQAQQIELSTIEGFETPANYTLSSWGYGIGDTVPSVVTNPEKTGINTSDNVISLRKHKGTWDQGVKVDLTTPYVIPSSATGLGLFMHMENGGKAYLKFMKSDSSVVESWGNDVDVSAEWDTVVMDIGAGDIGDTIISVTIHPGNWTDGDRAPETDGKILLDNILVKKEVLVYADPRDTVEAIRAGTMEIDGFDEEDEWKNATEINVANKTTGDFTDAELSASFKTLWDDDNLYLYVKVKDATLNAYSGSDPWYNDGFELYLSAKAELIEGKKIYGGPHHQIRFNYEHDGITGWSDKGIDTIYVPFTKFEQDKAASQYAFEMQIPFKSIFFYDGITANMKEAEAAAKETVKFGHLIGFEISILDATTPGNREHVLNWTATKDDAPDDAYSNSALWGAIELGGTNAINEFAAKNTFSVFPNPSSLSIHFNPEGVKSVQITDIIGKLVYSSEMITGNVDISDFKDGIYILKAVTKSNEVYLNKFIKK